MKTDVILSSTDRELFGITIRQNTKEQFLSVTDLQNAYEKHVGCMEGVKEVLIQLCKVKTLKNVFFTYLKVKEL